MAAADTKQVLLVSVACNGYVVGTIGDVSDIYAARLENMGDFSLELKKEDFEDTEEYLHVMRVLTQVARKKVSANGTAS